MSNSQPLTAPGLSRAVLPRAGAIALVVLLAGFFKGPAFFLPMGEDQAIFNYAGLLMLRGGQLYRDFWETKPPGEYLFRALVLGPLPDPWAFCSMLSFELTCGELVLQWVDLVYSLAIAAATFGVARWVVRPGFALTAAGLVAIYANVVMLSRGGNLPEKSALLPTTLGVWLYLVGHSRGRPWLLFLAGALVGVGIQFKQPAAMMGFALAAHVALCRHCDSGLRARSQRAAALAAGAAASFLPLAFYLPRYELVDDFWQQVVLFNLGQAASHNNEILPNLAGRTWEVFVRSSGSLWLLGLMGGGLLVAGRARGDGVRRLLLLWTLGSIGGVAWGGPKVVTSYFLWVVPAFAVLGSYAIQRGWDAAAGRWSTRRAMLRWVFVFTLIALVAVTSGFQRVVMMRVWNDRWPNRTERTMEEWSGAELRRRFPAGPSLFIWGGSTQIYLLGNARPPSRHTHAYFLSRVHSTNPSYLERRDELMRDLTAQPPDVVLVSPMPARDDPTGALALNLETFPDLKAFIKSRYERVVVKRADGWLWYERRDLPPRVEKRKLRRRAAPRVEVAPPTPACVTPSSC